MPREIFMAIKGLSLNAERNYISKLDKPSEGESPTTWIIGSLDSRILGMLQDKATTVKVNTAAPEDEVATQVNGKAFNFEVCQFGLRGWTNFKAESGDDIPYKAVKLNRGGKSYMVVDSESLSLIPGGVIEELAEQIMKDNQLSTTEGKA
jgi:hypothetical protein